MIKLYDDYTDAEIERMEREFDAWLLWCDEERERLTNRLVSSATPQETE